MGGDLGGGNPVGNSQYRKVYKRLKIKSTMALTKQDWTQLKKGAEEQLKSAEISTIQFSNLLKIAEEKLAEFPDEVKEVEAELNSLVQ